MWCAKCYTSNDYIRFHVRSKPGFDEEEDRVKSAWTAVSFPNEYLVARDGDHLITPFECDLCVFVKLKGRYPVSQSEPDKKLASCIRRVILDSFWSRAPTTVSNNLRLAKNLVNLPKVLGLNSPFVSTGPCPSFDHCGYQIAISMILMSTKPGRYDKSYTQFDTIRHLRSCFSNFERASPKNATSIDRPNQGDQPEISESVTSTLWFRRFYAGCKARMGQVVKPNLALSTTLIVAILQEVMKDYENSDKHTKFDLIVFGSYLVVSYVISLRGSEGLMLDLSVINRELKTSRDFCVIALKGRVKGETIDRDHLFPCVFQTSSGIDVQKWLKMLSCAHRMFKRQGGPAITNHVGEILSISQIDSKLHEYLIHLFDDGVNFPLEIKTSEDIYERFSAFRSLRRASNTRALNMNVSASDIDVINRWKTVEAAKGKKPNRLMRQYYAEVSELKNPFLRYTKAM